MASENILFTEWMRAQEVRIGKEFVTTSEEEVTVRGEVDDANRVVNFLVQVYTSGYWVERTTLLREKWVTIPLPKEYSLRTSRLLRIKEVERAQGSGICHMPICQDFGGVFVGGCRAEVSDLVRTCQPGTYEIDCDCDRVRISFDSSSCAP